LVVSSIVARLPRGRWTTGNRPRRQSFYQGLYAVRLERLETNNALQASDPADAGVIGKIEAFREAVTQNFDTGLGGIRIRDFPN